MKTGTLPRLFPAALALTMITLVSPSPAPAAPGWPELSQPAPAVGGGELDAAVVVGIEGYFAVPPVPGAKANALAWYDHLTKTLLVPPENMILLRDADATVEEMRKAAQEAAGRAGEGGRLWFVFVGHGAPAKDGKDGLLVGVDAQQKETSLRARSFSRGQLLDVLGKSRARSIHVILDACFSGRSPTGESLVPGLMPLVTTSLPKSKDPRVVVLTAARSDQFAGPLPGAERPAFSYLALGALRGWADSDGDGLVTAGEVLGYVERSLRATLRGRDQTPTLSGRAGAVLAPSALEKTPDLSDMAKLESGPQAKGVSDAGPPLGCGGMLERLLRGLNRMSFNEMIKAQDSENGARECLPDYAVALARPGREFINVLGLIGQPDARDLPAFVRLLDDERTLVRQNSALALAQMRSWAKPALDKVMSAARGSSGEERQRHVRAATMIAPTSREVWLLLMELYKSGTEEERRYLEDHIAMAARNGNMDAASLEVIKNGARAHKDRRREFFVETVLVVAPTPPETWEFVWEFYERPRFFKSGPVEAFIKKHAGQKRAHPADVRVLLEGLKKID